MVLSWWSPTISSPEFMSEKAKTFADLKKDANSFNDEANRIIEMWRRTQPSVLETYCRRLSQQIRDKLSYYI
jgi:hypothetical protein